MGLFFTLIFQEVVDFLREQYKLKPTEQEITLGKKFSFALYFDKKLNFINEMTFLTESYYIRNKRRIPKQQDFNAFEVEKVKKFGEMFVCSNDMNYRIHFNNAISSILKENNINPEDIMMLGRNYAIKEAVKNNLGISIISKFVAEPAYKNDEICILPLDDSYERYFSYILNNEDISECSEIFLNELRSFCKRFYK